MLTELKLDGSKGQAMKISKKKEYSKQRDWSIKEAILAGIVLVRGVRGNAEKEYKIEACRLVLWVDLFPPKSC